MGSAPSQDQKSISETPRQPARKASTSGASESGSQAVKSRAGPSIMPKRPAPQKSILKERLKWRKDPTEITTIIISQAGFSKTHVSICTGQFVVFVWDDSEGSGFNVTQVVHDGDQFRPVPGGIHSGQLTQKGDFEYQFQLPGEFKFVSAGIRCTPLTVSVGDRREIFAKLEDDGFVPKVLHLEAGESVKWSWAQCNVPHSVQQATYCAVHAGFKKLPSDKSEIATLTGNYAHTFKQAGIYYFMGSGNAPSDYHLCIVHVHDVFAEHRIEITDRSFEPPIVVVNAGDRVWIEWSRNSCQKKHNPYEISLPARTARKEESFKLKKQGFRWPQPSRGGLMAHDFLEPGVFYFSDYNHQEAAAYIGTIIVKKKPIEHFIDLSSDGFTPDLLRVTVGERVWWRWDAKEMPSNISIAEAGRTVAGNELPTATEACHEECQPLDAKAAESFAGVGTLAITPGRVGVYHHRVNNFPNSVASSTIIAVAGPRNHTISIGEQGFEPKKLSVAAGDYVWWVWQKSGRLHNIVQVSHEGHPLEDGFQSGALADPPCAFMQQFATAGVYYYQSESLRGTFGVVQCHTAPQLHEVQVSATGLVPDPIVAVTDDVVSWVFKGLRQHDVVSIGSVAELLDAQHKSQGLTPRRCVQRAFSESGVFNFTSKSFLQLGANKEAPMDESRISSVIVNERQDAVYIRVSAEGFFPASVAVAKGQTVVWDWTTAPEAEMHNIAHVNPPLSNAPLSIIHGDRSFNSGRPSSKSRFLYSFNRCGMFCVASLGVPGRCGTVLVLSEQKKTPTPRIVSYHEGGTVQRNSTIRLECKDPKAQIYYTLDGSPPLLHRKSVKRLRAERPVADDDGDDAAAAADEKDVYQTWEPLKLKKPGIVFIRAMAIAENCQASDIFTSKRFWVVDSNDAAAVSESEVDEAPVSDAVQCKDPGPTSESWKWFNCVPSIKLLQVADNCIEVYWDALAEGLSEMVAGYQIFLNGIAYNKPFLPRQNCFHVSGLAAGASYDICVDALPVDELIYKANRSNKLTFDCPFATTEGGPLISLELAAHKDTITVVWAALSHTDFGLRGYKVTLNGRQCGRLVSPEAGNKRCKVVIEGCTLNIDYQILVFAVKTEDSDDTSELSSNKLSFRLPLDTSCMMRPDSTDDDAGDNEFVFVKDGLGYHLKPNEDFDNAEGVSAAYQNGMTHSSAEEDEDVTPRSPSEKVATEEKEEEEEEEKEDRINDGRKSRARDEEEEENRDKKDEAADQAKSKKEKQSRKEEKEEDEKEERRKRRSSRHRRRRRRNRDESASSAASRSGSAISSGTGRSDADEEEDRSTSSSTSSREASGSRRRRRSSRRRSRRRRREEKNAVVELQEQSEKQTTTTTAGTPAEPAKIAAAAAGAAAAAAAAPPPGETANTLPRPIVQATPDTEHSDRVNVQWHFSHELNHHYRLDVCAVSIVGKQFSQKVNSDISFAREDGVLHSWTVTDSQQRQCVCRGLMPSCNYKISVSASYTPAESDNNNNNKQEYTTESSVCEFSTHGPPQAPQLQAHSVDVRQVTINWKATRNLGADELAGFQLLIDGAKQGGVLPAQTSQTSLEPLRPGRTIKVSVQSITKSGRTSEPSNSLLLTCPKQPPPPQLQEQPSSAEGTGIVSWMAEPCDGPSEEDVSKFTIVVNDMWHGELKAVPERRSYSYYLTDLSAGSVYDVQVKAIAGRRGVTQGADHIYCLCESHLSQPLSLSCSAPPLSPELRIEAMNEEGLIVSWPVPQQFGEARICGYQMLRDGQSYGSIIPPDTTSFQIRDLTLGQRIVLQLMALTAHPVGAEKRDEVEEDVVEDDGGQFGRCRPGAALVVNYTGLVQAPAQVWCDDVTGHSATVAWTKDSSRRLHFIDPDRYQVTWWPGDTADKEVNSLSTVEDFTVLQDLQPATVYTVVVEARSHQKTDSNSNSTLIVASKPQQITIRTAQPPVPVCNLGVVGTTSHSVLIAWDPPVERGCEVISLRVECIPTKQQQQQKSERQALDLMPDATKALIEHLSEKTEYVFRVLAVTDEAFQPLPKRHPVRVSRKLPNHIADLQLDEAWMPSASLVAATAGTTPPAKIRLVEATASSLKLRWLPPAVTGSTRLKGQIIRWTNISDFADNAAADYINLDPKDSKLTLENLTEGTKYRIVIEAVVSLKTALELETSRNDEECNRRTAHVASDAVYARTRCHVTQPRLLVTALRPDSVVLYWERPYSMAVVPRELPGAGGRTDARHIRCSVEGYRLEINGKPYVNLKPTAQSCTLVRCKPGKIYSCVLIALSQTDEAKKEAKRLKSSRDSAEQRIFVNDADETWSEPLLVKVPGGELGAIREFSGEYRLLKQPQGELRLRWCLDDAFEGIVQQFNVTWSSDSEARVQRLVLDAAANCANLETQLQRCVVTARINCVTNRETVEPLEQLCHVVVPGAPDPPRIFLDRASEKEIVIEWAEPQLWGGIGISGYQLHIDGKQAGDPLDAGHHRAVIPCRPNRQYQLQLMALSADPDFGNSELSNSLFVHTNPHMPVLSESGQQQQQQQQAAEHHGAGDGEIPLLVSACTDTTATVDWLGYRPGSDVTKFALQWSSSGQAAEKTETLAAAERSCFLQGLTPATAYTVRLSSLNSNGAVVDKSRGIRLQTCAPIETPVVSLQACNFSYISIQWAPPRTYGDASVSAFKIFVNGVVEETLAAEESSYSYVKGKWCQEYSFQVQAVCTNPKFSSSASEPLVVTWPGCAPTELRPLPARTSCCARVAWGDPYLTEGVKVKQYRLVCRQADTQQVVQVAGPLHPDAREAEVTNLKLGSYHLLLEVHLHGTQMVVYSTPLTVEPSLTPEPPIISVAIVGQERRRQLETAASNLVNRRDRYIRLIHSLQAQPAKTLEETQMLAQFTEAYDQTMDALDECFTSLKLFTGELLAQISWQCPQSNPEVKVTGYKVLVDGQQYGAALHSGISSARIKLGADRPSHSVCMAALCDSQDTQSAESNAVELLTEPFLPMAFFCVNQVHCGERWPRKGCCLYEETLSAERRQLAHQYNPGFMSQYVPAPSTFVHDISNGEQYRLLPAAGPRAVTMICFWTRWCLASIRYMRFFTRLASSLRKQFDFVAVATAKAHNEQERSALLHCVKENSFETKGLRHVFAVDRPKISKEEPLSTTEAFHIIGVPFFVVVHPEGNIAWRGRYCAVDYSSFEDEMQQVLRAVKDKTRLGDEVMSDATSQMWIDHAKLPNEYEEATLGLHQPSSFANGNSNKYNSGGKLLTKNNNNNNNNSNSKISVNTRPYSTGSASNNNNNNSSSSSRPQSAKDKQKSQAHRKRVQSAAKRH